jgi:ribosomal protein S27E
MGGSGRQPAGRSGRVEIRCTGCGYGGVVARLPARCPMCGARRWQRIGSVLLRSDGPPLPGLAKLARPTSGIDSSVWAR